MAYHTVRVQGHTFLFNYEKDHPELLHIFARHLMEVDDAVYIFFNGERFWNPTNNRWETLLDGEVIYWTWKNEIDKVVLVISCFRV